MLRSMMEKGKPTQTDIEAASSLDDPKERKHVLGMSAELVSGLAYCVASASMVLVNKAALSSFEFHSPNSLLFFQCFLAVVLVQLSAAFGWIKVEPLRWSIVRAWLPANLIFVGMIASSFLALKLLGVGMVTVLKNVANLFTIIGDYIFFGKTYGAKTWGCLALILGSAVCGGVTDLAFSFPGYMWQLINCLFTAGYSLSLKGAIEQVKVITGNPRGLSEFSKVYYNNVLSLGPIFVLMWCMGEIPAVFSEPALQDPGFLTAGIVSGLVGFLISFASLWFIGNTTATTYSLVGSLNKIPVAIIGILAFNAPTSFYNMLSIGVGLLAGVVFVWAKS